MHSSRVMTNLLRGGVSLAALAAAWGLPTAAHAQTCRNAVAIDGVAAGTAVTCPFSDVLTFPGGVSQGPGGVPDGSQLLGVLNGTDPTHQQWTFQDPAGNVEFIFLSGTYNLRNGIGGTTVLQGAAIRDLSGAGACGVGGMVCPGGDPKLRATSNFTTGTGGGAAGGFIPPAIADVFAPAQTSFQGVQVADLNATTCDAMPAGASCGTPFYYGPTAGSVGGNTFGFTGTEVTISGTGFQDFYLDTSLLPEDVAADLGACEASGGTSCTVVFDSQGKAFFYDPSVESGSGAATNPIPVSVVTDANGITVVELATPVEGFEPPDIAEILRQRGYYDEALGLNNLVVPNNATDPGGGHQGSFTLYGLQDLFGVTQPTTESASESAVFPYLLTYPTAPAGNYEFYNFGPEIGGLYVDLSSLPEVTSVTPGTQGDDDARRSFILTFSEPMDEASVEDNFIVRSFSGQGQANVDESDSGSSEFRFGSEFNTDVDFHVEFSGDGLQAELWVEEGTRLGDERADFDQRFSIGLTEAPGTKIAFQTPNPDPGSATATGFAVALIFGVFAEPDNGAQAAQMTDAVTAGVPTTDGKRDAVDTTRLMFQPAAVNVASTEPEIIGKAIETDGAGFRYERYVVRYPDGSLVAIDAAGQRIGPVTSFLGTYQVQREGTPLLVGMGPVVQEGANSFRIERPSNFIILPADQPAPSAGSLLPPATRDDLKAGSIVYDLQSKQPVGRVIDDQGHVELDNPSAYLPGGPTDPLPFPIPENVKVNIPPPA